MDPSKPSATGDGSLSLYCSNRSEHQEVPMPLTTEELLVLQRSLRLALESEETNEADKSVIRNMEDRIAHCASSASMDSGATRTENQPSRICRCDSAYRSRATTTMLHSLAKLWRNQSPRVTRLPPSHQRMLFPERASRPVGAHQGLARNARSAN